jgi:hypothetical protein
MDKGGVNIDIVFRNGLKDFEVLPPPEVWDNIHPVVIRKQKPFLLFRVAALIVVIFTLSLVAYFLNRDISTGENGTFVALNVKASSPILEPVISTSEVDYHAKTGLIQTVIEKITENPAESSRNSVAYNISSPAVSLLRPSNSFSKNGEGLRNRPFMAVLSLPEIVTNTTYEPDQQQYTTEDSPVNATGRWSIAAIASPTYYSRFNSGNSELSQQLMASEENVTSYSGGVAFSYKVNRRLSIQSGLFYSSLGQVVDGINSFSGFQKYDVTKGDRNFEVLTTSGTVYTNNGDVFLIATGLGERVETAYTIDVFDPKKASLQYLNNTIRQNFSYLELPVILRYKFIDKNIDFNFIGGLSYNMLVNNSVYTMINGEKYPIGKTEGVNQISLSSSLGMGMEYSFSEKLSLNLEPTFRYYLNPYTQIAGSNVHPYSLGIFSGLSYKF